MSDPGFDKYRDTRRLKMLIEAYRKRYMRDDAHISSKVVSFAQLSQPKNSHELDKIDILIRDNQTGKIMKIVQDEESESMIGISHPEKGHVAYLQFEVVN